jgi:hypothetical protein
LQNSTRAQARLPGRLGGNRCTVAGDSDLDLAELTPCHLRADPKGALQGQLGRQGAGGPVLFVSPRSHPPPGRARAEGEEMTKTLGEFEPPKPITKAERDARKAFRKLDAEKAMTEHEVEQKAFSANRERLKEERLTREAAVTPVAVKKAKTKRKAR